MLSHTFTKGVQSIGAQRGIAAIELTLLLPFLLVVVFFTAEIGRVIFQYAELTRMVRDGGSYISKAAFQEGTTDVLPAVLTDANCDNCVTDTKNILLYGQTANGSPLLNGLSANDISLVTDPTNKRVTISVVYDWKPIFGESLSGFSLTKDLDLSFDLTASYTLTVI